MGVSQTWTRPPSPALFTSQTSGGPVPAAIGLLRAAQRPQAPQAGLSWPSTSCCGHGPQVRAAWGMFTVPPGSLEPFPPAAEAPEQGSPCRLPGSAGLPLRACPARLSPSWSSRPLPHARVTQPYSKEWGACARGPPAMSTRGMNERRALSCHCQVFGGTYCVPGSPSHRAYQAL